MVPPLSTQVLVVGSGAAGLAAAIAAAGNGAEVVLVERHGFLGGLSTMMPWLGFVDRDYRYVVKGFAAECVRKLQDLGAASDYCLDPKCGAGVSVDGHAWKCLAAKMAVEARVRLLLHAVVVDTIRDGDRIAGVIVEHKSGRQAIHARYTIDCSGDADVAARAGVDCEKGRAEDGLVQTPSAMVRVGGVDRGRFLQGVKDRRLAYREWIVPRDDLWNKMMARIDTMPLVVCGGFASLVKKARDAGDLTLPQTRVVGVKTHRADEFFSVMPRVLGMDPVDAVSVTEAYARIYPQVLEMIRFFRGYVPGFADAYVRDIGPMLGIRESRRILGDYVLTLDDLVEGRIFDDSVALGGYHMDIHRPSGTWVESRNVRTYGIPLRCLIARGVEGLLMAGKCMSATHEALASTRVIPICMAQGQAAGTAAALAAKHDADVRQLDPHIVRQTLIDQGAEVGETLGPPDAEAIEQIGQLPLDEEPTTDEADAVHADDWLGRTPTT